MNAAFSIKNLNTMIQISLSEPGPETPAPLVAALTHQADWSHRGPRDPPVRLVEAVQVPLQLLGSVQVGPQASRPL